MRKTFSNCQDARFIHAQQRGKLRIAESGRTNHADLLWRQLRVACATASGHVVHILSVISKVKMLGIHAERVIAFMENKHLPNDRAISQFPRYSMSPDSFVSDSHHPIHIGVLGKRLEFVTKPVPTSSFWIRSVFGSKTFFNVFRAGSCWHNSYHNTLVAYRG